APRRHHLRRSRGQAERRRRHPRHAQRAARGLHAHRLPRGDGPWRRRGAPLPAGGVHGGLGPRRGDRPRGPGLPRDARVERGRHRHAPRAPQARAAIARRSRRGRRLHGLRLGAGARRDRARLGPVLGRAGKSAGSMKSASPRAALTAVVLSTVAANFTLTILSIALKPIAVELGSTVDAAGWLTVAPLLVSALVAPASGRASDR